MVIWYTYIYTYTGSVNIYMWGPFPITCFPTHLSADRPLPQAPEPRLTCSQEQGSCKANWHQFSGESQVPSVRMINDLFVNVVNLSVVVVFLQRILQLMFHSLMSELSAHSAPCAKTRLIKRASTNNWSAKTYYFEYAPSRKCKHYTDNDTNQGFTTPFPFDKW